MHAHGTFEVRIAPQSADNPQAEASGLARLSIDKTFHGGLDATSQGEMLATGGGGRKDGAYVAMETVRGSLDGRSGSFALVHRALLRDNVPAEWTVTVVPGSGTDGLEGLEGAMRIEITGAGHAYAFDYTLPAGAPAVE